MVPSMCLLMKIKMAIGCSSGMFHWSKFYLIFEILSFMWSAFKNFTHLTKNLWFFCLINRMFVESCKRLRIMKGSEAIGLGLYFVPLNFSNDNVRVYNIFRHLNYQFMRLLWLVFQHGVKNLKINLELSTISLNF